MELEIEREDTNKGKSICFYCGKDSNSGIRKNSKVLGERWFHESCLIHVVADLERQLKEKYLESLEENPIVADLEKQLKEKQERINELEMQLLGDDL